jgi:hypothetical protein
MPKIFEYLGIVILFYSDEHEPIHVHAEYSGSIVKVSFFIKNGEIYRITYKEINGTFPISKLKELKKFISEYKNNIIKAWTNYFILKIKVDFERITKKI